MGERAKHQLKLLEGIKRWLLIFHSEVSYSGITLLELAEQLAEEKSVNSEGAWSDFFENLAFRLNSNSIDSSIAVMWEESLDTSEVCRFMLNADRQEFIRFGQDLGCLDKASQLGRIDLYLDRVNMRIAEVEKGLAEKVRLCRLLGIAGGVFITILIV